MEEANQQIPWLEPRLRQIVALRQELARLHRDFQWLLRQSRSNGHTGVEAQIAAKRQEISPLADELARFVQEVHARRIMLRDPDRGLVDFPAVREGREVYLCWLLGEAQVGFWHEVDTGFAGRQPL